MSEGRRRGDAHRMLIKALEARAGGAPQATVAAARSEAWASATFRGARHMIGLRLAGDGAHDRAARLAGEIDAIEFELPGHLVADITVVGREDGAEGIALQIEALTVEDA